MTRKNRRTRNKSIRRKTKRTPIKGRKSMKKKSQRKERRSIRKGRRTNRKQRRSTRKQLRSTFRKRRSSRNTRKKRSLRKHRQDGGAEEPIMPQEPGHPPVENYPASEGPLLIGTETNEEEWKKADDARKEAGLQRKRKFKPADNPTSSSQAVDAEKQTTADSDDYLSVASSDASSSLQTPPLSDLGLGTADQVLEASASGAQAEAEEQVQEGIMPDTESIGPVANLPDVSLKEDQESSSSSDVVIEFLNDSPEKLELVGVGEGDNKDVQVSPKEIMEQMKDLIRDENMKELFEAKDEASFKSAMNNIGKNLSPDQQILTFPNGNKINIPKLIEKINDSPGGLMIDNVPNEPVPAQPSSTGTDSTGIVFDTATTSPGSTFQTGDEGSLSAQEKVPTVSLGPGLAAAEKAAEDVAKDSITQEESSDSGEFDTVGSNKGNEGVSEQDQAKGTIPDTTGSRGPAQIPGEDLEGKTRPDQVSFEEKNPGEVKNMVSGSITLPDNVDVPDKGTSEMTDFKDKYAKGVAYKVGVRKEDVIVEIINDMVGGGYYHLGGASVKFTIKTDPQKITEVKENLLKDNNLLIDGQNVDMEGFSLDETGQTVNLFPPSDNLSSLESDSILDSTPPTPIPTDSSDTIPGSDNGSGIFDKIIDDLETLYAGCGLK